MKKLITLIGIVAILGAFTGCGKTDGNGASAAANLRVVSSASATAAGISSFSLAKDLGLLPNAASGTVGSSASSVKVKISGGWVSPNADCTGLLALEKPAGIVEDAEGYLDVTSGITLVQGDLPAGTYNCLVLQFQDIVKFTPSGTVPAGCTVGTEYPMDVYTNDASIAADPSIDVLTGLPIAPASSITTSQDYFLIASTGFTEVTVGTNTNVSNPESAIIEGSSATSHAARWQTNKLDSALVIPAQATFYMDPDDQVQINTNSSEFNGDCWLEQPSMGFR